MKLHLVFLPIALVLVKKVTSQQEPCADVYRSYLCEEYARLNSCSAVINNCKKTCGGCPVAQTPAPLEANTEPCIDTIPASTCELFKDSNLCDAVPDQCRATCGDCGPNEDSRLFADSTPCDDKNKQCPSLQQAGFCTHDNVRDVCPFSCGSCIQDQSQGNIPSTPGTWSDWGYFSACSVSCGTGTRRRTRSCRGGNCEGAAFEETRCFDRVCPTEPPKGWSEWGDFGECSATCGSGTMLRHRTCVGGSCRGAASQATWCRIRPCPTTIPVAQWSKWSVFGACSVTCGDGIAMRTRRCLRGECQGDPFEERECTRPRCPTDEPECVDSLSSCSHLAFAPLLCSNFVKSRCPKSCAVCPGAGGKGQGNQRDDGAPASISTWSTWITSGRCSKPCGGGTMSYTRTCSGGFCLGVDSKEEDCNTQQCNWARWIKDGRCSRTCGGGVQMYRRKCIDGSCIGSDTKEEECNTQPCKGTWGPWRTTRSCSRTCGSGTLTKTRKCDGSNCVGIATTTEKCNTDPCEGAWAKWVEAGKCSKTCGGGKQTYKRKCIGGSCRGYNTRQEACNTSPCKGSWGSWKNIGICSRNCGGGEQKKTRTCEGDNCAGESTTIDRCNIQSCPKGCVPLRASGRVIGGVKEEITNSPWMVFVESTNTNGQRTGCGGTLVTTQWVLTAAHCVEGDVLVFAGLRIYTDRYCPNTKYGIEEKHVHPQNRHLINDLALIKLDRPVEDAPSSRVLQLQFGRFTVTVGMTCYATGWGSTNAVYLRPSQYLMKVSLTVLDPKYCKEAYGNDRLLGNFVRNSGKLICAGTLTGERDICQGDSGGPLTCEHNGRKFLAGITSFGPKDGCGIAKRPGMFVDVDKYRAWIENTMN